MDTLLTQTKKLWQSAKSGASCTNDSPEDEIADTEEALSREPVLKDPPRVHIVPRRDGAGGSNRAARTSTAVKYHMSLMADEGVADHPKSSQPNDTAVGRDQQGGEATASPAQTNGAALSNGNCTTEGNAPSETRRKMEELERIQMEKRELELLKLDPGCWKQLAAEGYFQRAEDDLTAAAKLEKERLGDTDRYASLVYALAALYDKRSYEDSTGQAHELSLTSAQYAQESLNIRMKTEEGSRSREAELVVAETMVLYGQSLANYALEVQGAPKVPVSQAFEDAKSHVKGGLDIRTRLEDASTIPENTFTLGYVYFCHAQVMMRPSERKARDGEARATGLYSKCLEYYFSAASLHAARDGEEAEASIRMVCNVALATSHMAEIDSKYLADAEQWYEKAIGIQEKVFGPGHRRTKMLKQDLLKVKKKMEEANDPNGTAGSGRTSIIPQIKTEDDEKREKEADELMQEFLSARRKERVEEQKGRYTSP